MKRVNAKMLEPIEDRKEWDKLVTKTIKIVNRSDKSVWELVLLAGQVETTYGENNIRRWADESGLGYSLARQYRWLSRKGVTDEFVAKWGRTDSNKSGLSYTIIREIAGFCGGVDTPSALEYLQWAVDHKATQVSVRGYMNQSIAPMDSYEETAGDTMLALRDKQQSEGFSDYVLAALTEILEVTPEARDSVMSMAITSVDDLEALKLEAGINTKDEIDLVAEAKGYLDRLVKLKRYLLENKKTLGKQISYDHELSGTIRQTIDEIAALAVELGAVEVPEFAPDESKVVSMD